MAKIENSVSNSKPLYKWVFWLVGLLSVIILILILILKSYSPEKKVTIDYKGQPYLGEKSAPVQVVEFGDYKCADCKNFNKAFFPIINEQFITTGKVRFYFMNYSFLSPDSNRAAQFAESVYEELGNKVFWKFHEHLYDKQPNDSKYQRMDFYTEDFLLNTLKEVSNEKDAKRVLKAFRAGDSKKSWEKDMEFVKKWGVSETPTVFINGKKFKGNTVEKFNKMIETEIIEKDNE
ncbi:DsbA family protein [Priestia megaterium]|uniref:DsbA family protein n=1 Tax=Priestia megaterium TaxID=1404 RepID=UPI002E23EB6A|nr:thioredoxin domain-containing protein [Priestia megaterium]